MRKFPIINLGGSFDMIPLSSQAVALRQPIAMVSAAQMAFNVTGPYFDPEHPEWGRFPRPVALAKAPFGAWYASYPWVR